MSATETAALRQHRYFACNFVQVIPLWWKPVSLCWILRNNEGECRPIRHLLVHILFHWKSDKIICFVRYVVEFCGKSKLWLGYDDWVWTWSLGWLLQLTFMAMIGTLCTWNGGIRHLGKRYAWIPIFSGVSKNPKMSSNSFLFTPRESSKERK